MALLLVDIYIILLQFLSVRLTKRSVDRIYCFPMAASKFDFLKIRKRNSVQV
jgi:hypothetical protein